MSLISKFEKYENIFAKLQVFDAFNSTCVRKSLKRWSATYGLRPNPTFIRFMGVVNNIFCFGHYLIIG